MDALRYRRSLPTFSVAYLVVFAVLFSPLLFFPLVPGAGFHDNQRIIEIFCSTAAIIVFALYLARNISVNWSGNIRLICLLVIFFALGLVSSLFAYSMRHALFEWANSLSLFGMSYIIAREVARESDALFDQILRLCGIGCTFYIFVEIVIYIAIIATGRQPSNGGLIFGFNNYRFFNHVQTITLPLLCLWSSRVDGGGKKMFAWGVASIWWTLLFLSASRGTFIGVLAGICVTLFYLRKAAFPWCRQILWTAMTGLGLYFLFYVLVPLSLGLQPFGFLFSVLDRTIENPSSSRWRLWVRAWEMTLAYPWLGAGPLHFAHYSRDAQIGAHPHNWVLQIASEWGVPALLCLITAIALGFKKLLAVRKHLEPIDSKSHLTLAALLTTAVAILVDGLVSGLIVMPTSQLWIVLYVGCAWGWTAAMTPVKVVTAMRLSPLVRIGGLIGVVMLIYFICNGLWPEIGNLPFYEEKNLQKDIYADPAYRPRVWLGGYF
ncbi:pilin glycosylation enzyme [Collimonas arenae]|uniref:Pilin glycosylation enzyme n=1 Tax=Collimonas arenae TaxID=279058 RepID=A0A0A1FFH2_9BURK|nr:O-antigen ligase family protein [Collimonas arenae]AIY43498.1 pilin glycosylation enzyme [Collimonas arenae]